MDRPEKAPTPEDIQTFRGNLSKAAFAEMVGVTPLTVYRWELPLDSEESRRPRGKVLSRLLALMNSSALSGTTRPLHSGIAKVAGDSLGPEERSVLFEPMRAIQDCKWRQAETKLIQLLASAQLSSPPARALAAIGLAKLQLLSYNDVRGAFATLTGAISDPDALPPDIQLQYHLVAALLFALPDANLFLVGKANHHTAKAQALLHLGDADDRAFYWYATFSAALALYEPTLMSRALEQGPGLQQEIRSPLSRLFVLEMLTVHSLYGTKVADALTRLDAFLNTAREHQAPVFEARALIWKAEVTLEEAASLDEALAFLETAEALIRAQRMADGPFTMMLYRNKGEVLLRQARLQEAEEALLQAERIGNGLRWTPVRIHTTLGRLYIYSGRIDDLRAMAERALRYDGWSFLRSTHIFGEFVVGLCDLFQGKAAPTWFDRLVALLRDFQAAGAWEIAYRYLVTYALGAATALATLEQANLMLRLAQKALDLSPSAMATARLRRYEAILRIREGHLLEGRQLLSSALATFEVSGNIPEAALIRPVLAELAQHAGDPEGNRLAAESNAELERFGLRKLPMVLPARGENTLQTFTSVQLHGRLTIDDLVVPAQRLTARGLAPHLLQRELVSVIRSLFPEVAVALFEVDSGGGTALVAGAPVAGSGAASIEFSDGSGRRFRLTAAPAADIPHSVLSLLSAIAGQSLEISALRGLGATPAASPRPVETDIALPGFIAASPAMRKLKGELVRLSGSRSTIIIQGESGTGKEVVARAVHDLSARAAKPYVTFNSAAVPRELFEGQLFGYRKGAFTGAVSDHPGVIRAAHGGTLFLDEIGELPLDIQPKLLRFLENGEVFPLGERKPIEVDVRVIAATHRDLAKLVREGKFREDLYYRLQVIPVQIPPLRERPADILSLARYFLAKFAPKGSEPPRLDDGAERILTAYAWPGNVRELRNVIERTLAFEPLPAVIAAQDLRLGS